jgi:hypothetical protein
MYLVQRSFSLPKKLTVEAINVLPEVLQHGGIPRQLEIQESAFATRRGGFIQKVIDPFAENWISVVLYHLNFTRSKLGTLRT